MKKAAFIIIVLCIAGLANAQTLTDDYLKKIPALPKDSCNITRAKAESFTLVVNTLYNEIDDQIDKLNQHTDQTMSNNEEIAKANAMNQMSQMYGMSQEDIEKLKNSKNMSAADKKALADKMLQQQTNMSMDEVKNLGKMSDAGKKAYAEAYAAEAMATSQTDPKAQARNASAVNLTQLISSQQAIQGKIADIGQRIAALYAPIENNPEGQKMLKNIETWQSKIMSMTGVDYGQGKQMDSLALLIKNEKIKYCNMFTPKYRAALRQHLVILKASIPEYQNLSDATSQLMKAQTGVTIPPESADIGSLGAVNGYLSKLKDAYKFKLYYPEDEN